MGSSQAFRINTGLSLKYLERLSFIFRSLDEKSARTILDGQVSGGDYSPPALDIGLGVRPDLIGQGHGSEYVNAVINFADSTYAPQRLRVTIAAFNRRARRVWEKAGFQVVGTFQGGRENMDFVIMMKAMSSIGL